MKKLIKLILIMIVILLFSSILINFWVIKTSKKNIITDYNNIPKDVDCILILGASIINNQPSKMLEDRLLKGIELYKKDISKKIIVSGDHINDEYDEVNVMKKYLVDKSIPSEKIFMDHYGISSYDSIYRAKRNYKVDKVVIITQKYHLYRSLYIAKKIGLEAYGIPAQEINYSNQSKREIREFFARIKDFLKCIIKPLPKFYGAVYNVKGNGNQTDSELRT